MEPICQNPHEIQERLSWSPGTPTGDGCECAQDSAPPQPSTLWGHDRSQLFVDLVWMFFVDRVCGCQDKLTLWIHGLHGWVQRCSFSHGANEDDNDQATCQRPFQKIFPVSEPQHCSAQDVERNDSWSFNISE